MFALMRSRAGSLWALLLLACSTHDASLGDSFPSPLPSPVPTPPVTLTCESRGGSCMSPEPGACNMGTWADASCQNTQQRCCIPTTPPPVSACDQQSHAPCYPLGAPCDHSLTGPGYECADGLFCCADPVVGSGNGGSSVGMSAPAGAGGL